MKHRKAFTLIELLVVIAIIALLMSILMPALTRVKKQARTSACLAQLKQWGLYFSMYAQDYNQKFMEGNQGTSKFGGSNRWIRALGDYYKWDSDFTCCPNATKPWQDKDGNSNNLAGTYLGSTTAWGYYTDDDWAKPIKGSYGINGWCNNPDPGQGHGGKPAANHWRGPNVRGAGYVPLFCGAQRYNFWPEATDAPPDVDGAIWDAGDGAHMRRVCLDRHDGFNNCLFLDFSVRKIGLKELWTLRWHKNYNEAGSYTTRGFVTPDMWPEWMQVYKDY